MQIQVLAQRVLAPTVVCMQILANGLWTLINGVITAVGAVLSPISLAVIIAAVSLAWLGRIEVAEMDRKGSKPTVRRH